MNSTEILNEINNQLELLKDKGYDKNSFKSGYLLGYAKALQLHKTQVSGSLIGEAVRLTKYAKDCLCIDDINDINSYLPCNVYDAGVNLEDNTKHLVRLEGTSEYKDFVYREFLEINYR